jgi:hypothetical protein
MVLFSLFLPVAARTAPATAGHPLLNPAATPAPLGQPAPAAMWNAPGADKALTTVPSWEYSPGTDYSNAGAAVSTVGDLNGDGYSDAAIGAPNMRDPSTSRTGAVLVFFGSASGLPSSPSQTIYGPNTGYYVEFGAALAPAGDINADGYGDLLVGAPGYGGDGGAFAFLGSSGGLQVPYVWLWTFTDYTGGRAGLGESVSPAGDVDRDGYDDVLVAAPAAYSGGRGMVWLFRGGDGGPHTAPDWELMGAEEGYILGYGLAAAGDVNADGYADVVLGAHGASGIAPPSWDDYYGKAMVFHGGPGGLNLAPTTTLYGTQFGSSFGAAVSGGGDMNGDGYADIAVGAPYWDSAWATDCGWARVYAGSSSGVIDTALWEEYGSSTNDQFGLELAPAGDINGDGLGDLAVGSPNVSNGGGGHGFAAVVTGSSVSSIFMPWYRYDTGNVMFGGAIGTGGDVDGDGFSDLLVGSEGFTGTQALEGRAQMFRGSADAPAPSHGWSFASSVSGSFYGWDLATAGDVNGDGFDDVLATAPNYSLYTANDGLVVLFYGSFDGPSTYANWYAVGASSNSSFGSSAACAGDLNGDGYDDIVVGAPDYSGTGYVSVWYGSSDGLIFGPATWTAYGQQVGSHFGATVASAGDVNGDGYGDLIVGSPTDDGDDFGGGGPINEGKAYVFLGSIDGLSGMDWSTRGNQADGNFGNAVAGAGDVNGDGFDDIVIGMEAWDQKINTFFSILDVGRAYVYHGGSTGLAASPATTIQGSGNANFGHSVDGAGDVDGDGYGDVIVTAFYGDPNDQGSVAVFRGGSGGISPAAHWSFTTGEAYSNLGSAGHAGDVNGDGLSDVVVGAVFADGNGMQDSGKVWVFAGPLTGASGTTPLRQWNGSHAYENLGNVAAGVGDVNGDGFADVGAGSPGYTGSTYSEGRTVVWFGNNRYQGRDTVVRCGQQMRADVTAPIGLGGLTANGADFGLRAWTGSAAGRTPVRLEWEVAPQGSPYTGSAVSASFWTDSAPYGAGSSAIMDSGPIAVPGAGLAKWRLRVASNSPYFPHSPWLSPSRNGREQADLRRPAYTSGVGEGEVASLRTRRLEASPNPFNPRTELSFDLPRGGDVRLQVYDVAGRLVATLLDEPRAAGPVAVMWDGNDATGRSVASGTYFARVAADGVVATAKLTLVR